MGVESRNRYSLRLRGTSWLWRAVVVTAAVAVAVAASSGAAHALPDDGSRPLQGLRGALIAAVGAGSLVTTAWTFRRAFGVAGLPSHDPLVPPQAPRVVQAAGQRLGRSRWATVAATLSAGLVLGLLTGGLAATNDDRDRVAGRQMISQSDDAAATSESGGGGGSRAFGPAGEGARSSNGDAGGGSGGGDGGGDPAGTAGNGGGDEADGGSKSGGTTTTTKPRSTTTKPRSTTTVPPGGSACDALDDYDGDVEAILDLVGASDADDLTDEQCEEAEELIDDIVGNLPVTTTTVTLPPLPVTTTTVTLPPLPVTTTTVTLPLGL